MLDCEGHQMSPPSWTLLSSSNELDRAPPPVGLSIQATWTGKVNTDREGSQDMQASPALHTRGTPELIHSNAFICAARGGGFSSDFKDQRTGKR